MRIFLICPVRKGKKRWFRRFLEFVGVFTDKEIQEQKAIAKYVADLEKAGHKVHWPLRDTNQNDPIGLRICSDNREAILESGEIHIWWNKKSQGSLFDFGMAFAFLAIFRKKIVLANPESVERTPTKSFNNVLLELHNKKI